MKALLVLDMQADLIAADGAYAQAGTKVDGGTKLVPDLAYTMDVARSAGIPILAAHLTVLTDSEGDVVNLGHMADMWPFLLEEGLRRETDGHELHSDLPEPDIVFEHYRFSPFYGTPLELILLAYDIDHLVLAGLETHTAVEACARDAVTRDYEVTILTDLCASFDTAHHEAALTTLATMATMVESGEFEWKEAEDEEIEDEDGENGE